MFKDSGSRHIENSPFFSEFLTIQNLGRFAAAEQAFMFRTAADEAARRLRHKPLLAAHRAGGKRRACGQTERDRARNQP